VRRGSGTGGRTAVAAAVGGGIDVCSAVSGPGWCAGILTATKVCKNTKVFVCIWSEERQLMFVPLPHVALTNNPGGPQKASKEQLARLGAAMDKLDRLLNAGSYYSNSLRAQAPLAAPPAVAPAATPAISPALPLPPPLGPAPGRRKRAAAVAAEEEMRPSSRPRRASSCSGAGAGGGGEEEVADDDASMADTEGGTEDGEAELNLLTVQQLRERLAQAGASSVPRSARKADLVQLLEAGRAPAGGRAAKGAGSKPEVERDTRDAQLKALQEQVEAQKRREMEMVRQHKEKEAKLNRLAAEQEEQLKRVNKGLEDERLNAQRVRDEQLRQQQHMPAARRGVVARVGEGGGRLDDGEKDGDHDARKKQHTNRGLNLGQIPNQRDTHFLPLRGKQPPRDRYARAAAGAGGHGGTDEEQWTEEDEVPTPKAGVQFVRKALGLEAGAAEREVARAARRMLREVRPEVKTDSISEIPLQAEQYFREKADAEEDLLTPSPPAHHQPKASRAGRRGPRGLPKVYPVGEEPPRPHTGPVVASVATYPAESQVNVYTSGAWGAGGSRDHGHQGAGGSSVDTMEAMLLMQQADQDERAAQRMALLMRAAQRK